MEDYYTIEELHKMIEEKNIQLSNLEQLAHTHYMHLQQALRLLEENNIEIK